MNWVNLTDWENTLIYLSIYQSQKLTTAFNNLYQQNQHLIKLSTSLRENHTEALFLADGVQGKEPVSTEALREIAHIHGTGDHSVHVTVSPQDCEYKIKYKLYLLVWIFVEGVKKKKKIK